MKVRPVVVLAVFAVLGAANYFWLKRQAAYGDGVAPEVSFTGRDFAGKVSRIGPVKIGVNAKVSSGGLDRVELLIDGTIVQTTRYAAPYPAVHNSEYLWAARPAGHHTVMARAIAGGGRTTETTNQPVEVVDNLPPDLKILSPEERQVFKSNILQAGLTAMATDREGKVAKVEYFLGGQKIGEYTTAPYLHRLNHPAPGNYELVAKATDDQGAVTEQKRHFSVVPGLPYTTAFTAAEGFPATGLLDRQSGWYSGQGTAAEIVDSGELDHPRALLLPPAKEGAGISQVGLRFGSDDFLIRGVIYCDVLIKPVADENIFAASLIKVGTAEVALLRHGAEAEVQVKGSYVFNGKVVWRSTHSSVPVLDNGRTQDWLRLTLRCDLQSETWDLYVNGRMRLHDRQLFNAVPLELNLRGHPAVPVLVGRVALQNGNPLFKEIIDDGIDDEWEARYKLVSSRKRRYADTDADGLSDIDEYIWGTNPRNSDTDGDGAPDGYEVKYGLDPLKPLTPEELASDADNDGVPLSEEITRRTSPVKLPPWEDDTLSDY